MQKPTEHIKVRAWSEKPAKGPSLLKRMAQWHWIVDVLLSMVLIRSAVAYFQWLPDGALGIAIFAASLLLALKLLATPVGKPPAAPLPPAEWGQPPSSR